MKHLQEIPEFICPSSLKNYVIYSDTDSIYVHAEPLLRYLYLDFDNLDEKDKDKRLEKIALEYQDIINESYNSLTRECFNVEEHRLEMKTEAVIRSAYFRSTRRYAQWITKKEGIDVDELDIKGLEFKKANFPPDFGKFFREALIDILKGQSQNEIDKRIKKYKNQILDGEISINKLGNPTSVKTLTKYLDSKPKKGEILSKLKKRTPAAVRAVARHNDLLNFWDLNKKHKTISPGDKVKWVYLKSNPYHIEAIAFLDYDISPEILTFIETYVNRKKIFESILLNKLEGLYSDLEWVFNTNEHIDIFFNF